MISFKNVTCEDDTHTYLRQVHVNFDSDIEAQRAKGKWLPKTHQIVWCIECAQIVSQENNDERMRMSLEFMSVQ